MTSRLFVTIASLAALTLDAAAPAQAARRSALTPLAEAQLFISPCGRPYRSQPGEPYPVVAWFRATDSNHDGRIDRAEFRADAAAFFKLLDRNGDGVVEEVEIYIYERAIVPEINAGIQGALDRAGGRPLAEARLVMADDQQPRALLVADDDKPDQPPQVAGAASYGLLNDPEPVRSADQHLRGKITLEDFLARADQNFDALVPSGRDVFTLDELPLTPVQQVAAVLKRR